MTIGNPFGLVFGSASGAALRDRKLLGRTGKPIGVSSCKIVILDAVVIPMP
ncbi:MAG: hypothetical protein ACE5HI_17700 [bacterium]